MKIYLLYVFLLIIIGCNNNKIESQPPKSKVIIDSELSEWSSLNNPKNELIGVGVMNDDSNLYIALSTFDESIIKNVTNGLKLWINGNGEKKETFGIIYPLQRSIKISSESEKRSRAEKTEIDEVKDIRTEIEQILTYQDFMVIVDEGYERSIPLYNGNNGIHAKIGFNNYNLNYELKVPLEMLNITKNKIYLGLETIEIEKPSGKGNKSGGGKQDGGGRSGKGNKGGKPTNAGGSRDNVSGKQRDSLEPIKYWVKVKLENQNNK